MSHSKNFQFINSKFTRHRGYIDIQSSQEVNHKKAVQILNSFTPQGASPKISLRIGSWNEYLGAGYYYMEDDENAVISTVLMKMNTLDHKIINLPLSKTSVIQIASGDHKWLLHNERLFPTEISNRFDSDQISMILFSLLAGDNIIIIHPQHRERVKFIRLLLDVMPTMYFEYNRITTGCAELDGNENIIGVETLPPSFRSHKKLYMPLDTIFIDLQQDSLMGEGLKSNDLTVEISKLYHKNKKDARRHIINYFKDITQPHFKNHSKYGSNSTNLTNTVRSKLGLEEQSQTDWIMTF